MTTPNVNEVVCGFCGQSVPVNSAVEILLMAGGDETQTIYAHPAHLRQHLHHSVPLHPDIQEAADRNPDTN